VPRLEPLRVELDVDLESEPIQGELRSDCGIERSFQGWMELTSAIEEARAKARTARNHREGEDT